MAIAADRAVRDTGLDAPAQFAFAITPSDSDDLDATVGGSATRGVWVGGAGNLNVDMASGPTVLFSGVAAGTLLPIRVKRVRSTSTTATNIVGLW